MDPHSFSQTSENPFDILAKKARLQTEYWVEGATIEFTENVLAEMDKQGLSRADLASKLKSPAPYVTRILRGTHNYTLRKMVEVAIALGCELRLHLQPAGAKTIWHDYVIRDKEDEVVFKTEDVISYSAEQFRSNAPKIFHSVNQTITLPSRTSNASRATAA